MILKKYLTVNWWWKWSLSLIAALLITIHKQTFLDQHSCSPDDKLLLCSWSNHPAPSSSHQLYCLNTLHSFISKTAKSLAASASVVLNYFVKVNKAVSGRGKASVWVSQLLLMSHYVTQLLYISPDHTDTSVFMSPNHIAGKVTIRLANSM